MGLKDKFVLMLDDDFESCALVKRIIENAGCHFQAAYNIHDAIEQIQENTPSIIFLDLHLGTENGFNFLEQRNKDPLLKRIPVVVFSAITRRDVQEKAYLLGANDYLEKPIRASAILQKLRKNLKEHTVHQYFFPPQEHVNIKIKVDAELKRINEISAYIRSSIKMEEGVQIEIESELLAKLGMIQPQKGQTIAPSFYAEAGIFDTPAQLLGLNEKILTRIKKIKTML